MDANRRLLLDTRGALMVMAAFVAIFLVGIVYHLAGIGGAALEQQIMQDAADAVTFSAATANARGMNILALINLIMAAALAVLVALRLVVALLALVIVILGAACAASFGTACGFIAPVVEAEVQVKNWADQVEKIVKPLTNSLEEAGNVVNQAVPVLAQAEAVYISTRKTYDPATVGFVWPIAKELPTKTGTFEELCDQAAHNVADVAEFFLPDVIPDCVMDEVGDLLAELATGFSDFFCGNSDSAPSEKREEDVAYPINDHTECDDAAALPDEYDGQCASSLCHRCSAWGCAKCLFAQKKRGYKKGKWTSSRDIWVEWQTPSGLEKAIESSGVKQLEWIDRDPCKGVGTCGYPVCIDEDRQVVFEPGYPEGAVRVIRTVYTALHACIIEEEVKLDIEIDQANKDEWGRPRVLDAEKLPEGARMRGVVLGTTDAKKRLGSVAVAARGNGGTSTLPGRVSFAGAEYFSPDQDLWHMTWRSRLIRFRFRSSTNGSQGMSDSCQGDFFDQCKQVSDALDSSGGIGGLIPADLDLEEFLAH